jgi:hypothetical protein
LPEAQPMADVAACDGGQVVQGISNEEFFFSADILGFSFF